MNKINQMENAREQKEQQIVNGVNVTKLSGAVEAIKSNSDGITIQFPCQRKMD